MEMPALPPTLRVTTEQQFKALGHPLRARILQAVQFHPATAKQLAVALGSTPGAIGHHLRMLEGAGLVQVVARRLINNLTIATYYTRTAAIFDLAFPREVSGESSIEVVLLHQVRDEMVAALPQAREGALMDAWFPHKQLAPQRMRVYHRRIQRLIDGFLAEAPDPDGRVYSLFVTAFRSPPYMQPREPLPDSGGPADSSPAE